MALLTLAAHAADDSMHATRLLPGERIALDGTLSHPAWQRAPVFDRSHEIDPVRGRAPTHAMRVQLLYDDQALYIGVTALDPQPAHIRAPLVRHDLVNRTQDFVVVYVDPVGTRQSAQFFRIGASGSTADGLHTAANDFEDFAPDFDFDSAVTRHAQGYTVVLRVPYATLRYTADRTRPWRVMVGRRIPREDVTLTLTVPLPREALSFIDTMQAIEGFSPPVEHGFLQLRPTLTVRRTEDRPHGGPDEGQSQAKLSLDAKWRPRPELVLDATLNPDFAQVALDEPQLSGNTRFALFLNEKRPFFLESSDLLVSPTDALYTRSINDPRGGLRATWRGESLAGTAMAVRDKGGGLTPIPGPYATDFALQPRSDALLSRAHWHQGTLTLAGMAGARRYRDETGASAGDNVVAGADLQWLVTDTWRVKAQAMGSDTRALDDGSGVLRRAEAQSGGMAYLGLYGRTESSETELSLQELSHGFRNDLGFVAQTGVRKLIANQNVQWFQQGPFHVLEAFVDTENVEERGSGRTVLQRWKPGLWFTAARNSEGTIAWVPSERSRVRRDGPLLEARYLQLSLQGTPVQAVPLAHVWLDVGRMADVSAGVDGRVVRGRKYGFDVQMRPLPWLELQPRLDVVDLDNPVEGRLRETAAQLLGIAHLGPRQTLRLILQRQAVDRAGTKDAETAQSLTYAWRRSAGTVLYLGATRGSVGLPLTPSRSSEVFAKLQVDVDEWRR